MRNETLKLLDEIRQRNFPLATDGGPGSGPPIGNKNAYKGGPEKVSVSKVGFSARESEVDSLNETLSTMQPEVARTYAKMIQTIPQKVEDRDGTCHFNTSTNEITYYRTDGADITPEQMMHECGHYSNRNTTFTVEEVEEHRGKFERGEDGKLRRGPSTFTTVEREETPLSYMHGKYSQEKSQEDYQTLCSTIGLSGRTEDEMSSSESFGEFKQCVDWIRSKVDDDYGRGSLSDFVEARAGGVYVGVVIGGHGMGYWNRDARNALDEGYTEYCIMRAKGREDVISAEREISPHTIAVFEETYEKSWGK